MSKLDELEAPFMPDYEQAARWQQYVDEATILICDELKRTIGTDFSISLNHPERRWDFWAECSMNDDGSQEIIVRRRGSASAKAKPSDIVEAAQKLHEQAGVQLTRIITGRSSSHL